MGLFVDVTKILESTKCSSIVGNLCLKHVCRQSQFCPPQFGDLYYHANYFIKAHIMLVLNYFMNWQLYYVKILSRKSPFSEPSWSKLKVMQNGKTGCVMYLLLMPKVCISVIRPNVYITNFIFFLHMFSQKLSFFTKNKDLFKEILLQLPSFV